MNTDRYLCPSVFSVSICFTSELQRDIVISSPGEMRNAPRRAPSTMAVDHTLTTPWSISH